MTARLKLIRWVADPDTTDERHLLKAYLGLLEQDAEVSRNLKEAKWALDEKVAAQYGLLSEAEVKTLVMDDKWLATLTTEMTSELVHVSQALTGRIKELTERYATPLPKIMLEVEELTAKVDAHLKKMGFRWY